MQICRILLCEVGRCAVCPVLPNFRHFYFSFDTTIAQLRATPKASPMEIILPLSYKMIDDLLIKCVGSRKEDIYC